MSALRKCERGINVKEFQQLLNKAGANVGEDGNFGPKTEIAVKQFQAKQNLHVDGIVGRRTLAALGKPMTSRPPQPPISGSAGRQAVGAMGISASGMTFIFHREARIDVSCYLHWPGGASGVTLGPGYDMKGRSEQAIKAKMIEIGVDAITAEKISKAAGLQDDKASQFVADNATLVRLTADQETNLLRATIPPYVNKVRNGIFVPLRQYEFDALVSFAYNPGGRLNDVFNFINGGNISDAMTEIKRANTSKHKVVTGLINRRNFEVNLYLNGDYGIN
ncbi:peptidoglycan-binding protein [Enterobacter sp. Bisph1]|uniref:peptidoglycan-binding protein n=1 Tax=Enterobacter sp. Bisph1 TaxID=1274399 RepID=UPI00057BF6D3|nr:peptidoglycan-binding protein [Enterobacter sp. Bisph1]